MHTTHDQNRRDFLKTAAMGAVGMTAVNFNNLFASPKAWTKVQINPAIDNTRVVCCHDAKMLPNLTANQSFASQNSAVSAAVVSSNMDQMAMMLTQKTTAALAWSTIFQKPASKAWADVRVALKTNGIGGTTTNRPRVAIYKKICDVLIDQLGVPGLEHRFIRRLRRRVEILYVNLRQLDRRHQDPGGDKHPGQFHGRTRGCHLSQLEHGQRRQFMPSRPFGG